MIDLATAWDLLLPFLDPLPPEDRPRRQCLDRVLAADRTATVDVPPADLSAMDGYAYAGEVQAGSRLPVGERIAAGDPPGRELPAGGALPIMTGAPTPDGADRVVRFEDTERLDAAAATAPDEAGAEAGPEVEIRVPPAAGANIRRRAEVLAAGDPLLAAGTVLGPPALALAAAHGLGELPVFGRPEVAVLPTGDEVVPPEAEPGPGQIRDTHTDYLLAAGRRLGFDFQPLGIAPDEPKKLAARLAQGLEVADVLLVGGGVSAGELDFVEGALVQLGCRALFTSVAVQPGKPLVAAVRSADDDPQGRRRLVFGLPGNPASVRVTYRLVVRPALERLSGRADASPWDALLAGELAAPCPGAKGRDRYLPARAELVDGVPRVTPLASHGSHDMSAPARGGALVLVPARSAPRQAGEACRVLLPE